MVREVDLCEVFLTEEVYTAWQIVIQDFFRKSKKGIDLSSISEEKGRINEDGTLTIFTSIQGVEVSMNVLEGQWLYGEIVDLESLRHAH